MDVAASILATGVESAVKLVIRLIKRQFIYLCCFSSNIIGLKDEAQNLDDVTRGLQEQVDAANSNGEDIIPEVEEWLRASNNMKEYTNVILGEVSDVEGGCLRIAPRISLSRKAIKTVLDMEQHQKNCNFNHISRSSLLANTYEFYSQKQIEKEIMTALRHNKESMIGICGMGGVGKTTVARRIMNKALEEHVFEEVVIVVVSQQLNELKIQLDIGSMLGLDLKNETPGARIQKLHERLNSDIKRILLVLDDVWEHLVLENIGIPCGSKGCTILITSRNSDALWKMNVGNIYEMKVLSVKTAWFLFREKAGTCVDNPLLNHIVKQVIRECKGLPINLATVGAALKDEMDESIWIDALKRLQEPNPNNIPHFIIEVYNALNVSYDKLDNEEVKSLFLLCGLFPEDANISLECLTHFCMGLHIFEDIGSLKELRDMIHTLVKKLKSRSLLLNGRDEDHVRMNDTVRDVCIYIAKQKGYIGGNDCTWISSGTELPTVFGFPNLRLLFSRDNEFKIDNIFLEGIISLYVLSLENYSLTLLPHTTQSLENLRTLLLTSCWGLETISIVGKLVNLEILICRDCGLIKELPLEIKRLNGLKLLELSGCPNLQRIGPGIISSLVGLEELRMLGSFNRWEVAEDGKRQNAGLRELESLTKLTFLEIEIQDHALAADEILEISTPADFHIISKGSHRDVHLHWKRGTSLGHWFEMKLLRDTKCLRLTGNGANYLDLTKIHNIQRLQLGNCQTMKNFLRATMNEDDGRYGGTTLFPLLEDLHLFSLPELEKIWDIDGSIPSDSFKNLKELRLKFLPAIKHLWQSSSSRNQEGSCLLQLERLEIESCDMMEQVFWWNEESENQRNNHMTLVFPKLKFMSLSFLPMLTNFCKGIERIKFPLFPQMNIVNCPKLKSYVYRNEKLMMILNTSKFVQYKRGKDATSTLQLRRPRTEDKGERRLEDSSNEDN